MIFDIKAKNDIFIKQTTRVDGFVRMRDIPEKTIAWHAFYICSIILISINYYVRLG